MTLNTGKARVENNWSAKHAILWFLGYYDLTSDTNSWNRSLKSSQFFFDIVTIKTLVFVSSMIQDDFPNERVADLPYTTYWQRLTQLKHAEENRKKEKLLEPKQNGLVFWGCCSINYWALTPGSMPGQNLRTKSYAFCPKDSQSSTIFYVSSQPHVAYYREFWR